MMHRDADVLEVDPVSGRRTGLAACARRALRALKAKRVPHAVLYSNQPKHLGDFARIVTDTRVDIGAVERYLADVHPEMLPEFSQRVQQARAPKPDPPRPTRRRTPRSPRRAT